MKWTVGLLLVLVMGMAGCGGGDGVINDQKITTKAVYSTVGNVTRSKVYMGTDGDIFTISNSGTTVYGNMGYDIVTISAGISGVILDQNVERIDLSEASNRYTFKQTGNTLNVYDATGVTLLVKVPVQGDADGTVIGFSNGTASALLSGGIMTLGFATVSPSAVTMLSVFTANINGADQTTGTVDASTYTVNDLNTVVPVVKILSATVPAKNPVVEVQVIEKSTGRGISGLKTFGLQIAKLMPATNGSSSYWVNYIDKGISLPAPLAFATTNNATGATVAVTGTITKPSADPGKTLVAANAVGIDFTKIPVGSVLIPGYTVVDKGNGTYSITFGADITSNANAPYDANATTRVGVTVTTVATPGVTATGPIDPATGAVNTNFAANNRAAEVYDFIPATGNFIADATGKQTFRRNIVPTTACNGCHMNIASISDHTARPNVLLCDICHTSTNTSGEAEFTTFIHRIHMGKNLVTPVKAENVVNPTKPLARTSVLVAYDTFALPMDIRNCTVCHTSGIPMIDANRKNCGSCHIGINWSTGKGTTNAAATTGHVGGAQSSDNVCALCHAATSVLAYHLVVATTTTAAATTTTRTTTTTTVPTTAVTIVISANTAAAATAAADVFKLTAATTGYTATISGGFNYLVDKISRPAGSYQPSALAEGVNTVLDGKVDLTWNSNGQTVIISLTGLSNIDEQALQSNAVPSLFTTY